MDRDIHFVAGLPRAGSTLLCNILNQNPAFWATPTSGLIEIVLAIRNQWENVSIFKAAPNMPGKEAVLKGIIQNYYSVGGSDGLGNLVDRPIIFDKNRGWLAYIETLEFVLGRKIKILANVRDIVDIVASFEKLYRKHTHIWQFPQEKSNMFQWQTVEDRAALWMHSEQPVGIAYNRLRDAIQSRGFADRIHLVEFENLTREPASTMKHIYEFLEMDFFWHNFENIEQTTHENDLEHGIPGLHVVRNKIQPVPSYALEVLGEDTYDKYKDAQFWR